jgi:hypothetical protein
MNLVDIIAKQYGTTAQKVEVEISNQPWALPKKCFDNAYYYASKKTGALYILGHYVMYGVPIEHAWIKEGDRYLDTTIKNRIEGDQFMSLFELDTQVLASVVMETGRPPNLNDYARFLRNRLSPGMNF